ncbi:MAG: thioesterase family protein [Beijerinckiaceae bacterium]
MRVENAWIDYNGHLNMAYYHVLFDRALDELFAQLGLGPDYLRSRNASTFAAECHIRYVRELNQGDPVRVTMQLVDFDDKRMHLFQTLRHATEGWISATSEHLSLHVDMSTRKVAPLPEDILGNLAVMKALHGRLPRPDDLGRIISFRKHASGGLSAPAGKMLN